MKPSIVLALLVACGSLLVASPAAAAASEKKAEPAKKESPTKKSEPAKKPESIKKVEPTKQDKEIAEAEKSIAKFSSSQKGKFTQLLNSGTADELDALPHVGERTVKRIIAARPFSFGAEIAKDRGIGLEELNAIVAHFSKPVDKSPVPAKAVKTR